MSQKPDAGADIAAMDYEQARDELVDVVRALETGGLGLDESVALWERGELLARRCEQQLAGARERVEDVLRHADAETVHGDGDGDANGSVSPTGAAGPDGPVAQPGATT